LKDSKWESPRDSVAEEASQSRGFSQEDDPTYANPSSATISLYSLLLLLPHSFPSMSLPNCLVRVFPNNVNTL